MLEFARLILLDSFLQDKAVGGWLVWPNVVDRFRIPDAEKSEFKPWNAPSEATIKSIREAVNKNDFWKDLAGHFSEENHATVITQDNVSCVKSICKPSSLYAVS